jgi:ligand-binding sensor domain-containing protein/signal transduction histidine kinase
MSAHRALVLACLLLVWCAPTFALDPTLDVNQYAHTSWRIREGFTRGTINAIAQTPDGYLWLGTEFGLVRFDGVRTMPWQPPPDQQLPSNIITRLHVARDGTLWIGTRNGLASWKGGTLTLYAELAGKMVMALLEDRKGLVWAGTLASPTALAPPTWKLCAIRDGSRQCTEEESRAGDGVYSLYEDRKGSLWVGMLGGLRKWTPGPPEFRLPSEPNGIRGLAEDDAGTLLIGLQGGIRRFVDGKPEPYALPSTMPPFQANTFLRDRQGALWIATSDRALVHVHHGRTDLLAQSDGLTADRVNALFEDREGSIWVASENGLDRFRDLAVTTYSERQGLSNAAFGSVLADEDGSVWLTTRGGLNRWIDGQVRVPRTGSAKRDGKLDGEIPNSLFRDDRGRLWVTTYAGIGYLEGERFTPVRGLPSGNVQAIAQDGGGDLWIANVNAGLFRLSPPRDVREIPASLLGRHDPVSALAADPLPGRGVWIGFREGGIVHLADSQVRESYGAPDGLGGGRVNRLRFDPEGTLWAGTDGGLSRLKHGRIATLTSRNGLPCDTVIWGIEDDARRLWLYMVCGLVRVARPELDAWAAAADRDKETRQTIQVAVFDSSDGVRLRPDAGGYVPPVTKSTDGRVWFAGSDGVSVFDPAHLPFNKLPPPVHIEQVTADRKTYVVGPGTRGRLSLPPLVRDLQLDYTALSLVAPEKVRFRYRLEGWDREWQDVGNRRQAFYANLPPRDYRFRVTACNNSGMWNEAGAILDFSIAPAYYQTAWFRVSAVVAFLGLLAALYQLRLRQVARHVRSRMEGRLEERERIARDLHDTLLQSVQGLILMVHADARQLPPDEPARQRLEKTLDHADRVLAEGRDRVRGLRATAASLSDLPAAFQRVAEETPRGRRATLKTILEGTVRELHPMVLEESFGIGREALVNALTHSEGRSVEVEITYDPRQFRLRVRDDGRGIDPAILEDGGRAGHWGLQGMRERAQKIGAQLQLWNRPGTGAEVELIVPAAAAYRTAPVESKKSWFRRSSGTLG